MPNHIEFILPDEAGHGIEAFVKERSRQVLVKGFTPYHDMHQTPETLLAAAVCYTEFTLAMIENVDLDSPPFQWPWDTSAWKPSVDPLVNMAKAGALLAAAYDRIVNHGD